MEKTVRKNRIRTDKPPKPKSRDIITAKEERKTAKKEFEKACKEGTEDDKITSRKKYQETQHNLRRELEKHEIEMIEKRISELTKQAKIDPNTIWKARKKASVITT